MNHSAFSGPELCRLEAVAVVDLLRRGEVSPLEVLDAALARIEVVEPAVNAMPTRCVKRAHDAIANLHADDSPHALPGWLAGLPIAIKDLTPVAGVRTTFGTFGMADFVPDTSDPLVERLEKRGGIVVGKTNTPEMGAGANTFNAVFGPTLNPWDTHLNAGGSSGGAAVSLATGEIWLSHGSDHGGSLRTPAAFCGIVGLRPSPGRAGGASPEAAFLIEGVQGPMARSVRDCALFLDAMSGFEPRMPISFPAPDTPFQDVVARADQQPPVAIAYSADLDGFAPADDEVAGHLKIFMEQIQRHGVHVAEVCPALPRLEDTYHCLRGQSFATMARRLPPEVSRHFKDTLQETIRRGNALTMDELAAAHHDRSIIFANMLGLFERFDIFACPVVGCMPKPVAQEWVSTIGGQTFGHYVDWLRFAFLATVTGLPAISVPVGIGPRGLPVGLQLVGKPRGEAALLAAARFCEMVAGGPLGPIDPCVTSGPDRG